MARTLKPAEIAKYEGIDPLDLPNYGLTEAALYLGIPPSTLRAWIWGRRYRVSGEERYFKPLIAPPERRSGELSHHNLVEAYVLDSIRKSYGIRISEIRDALDYATRHLDVPHPLASETFSTDRVYLFIERAGQTINVSMRGKVGQVGLPGLIEPYFKRIAFDDQGQPMRLFLFTRDQRTAEDPKTAEIRPLIASGRPVITDTRITLETVAGRFRAGETWSEMAEDYGLEPAQVEEAVRCWSTYEHRAATFAKSRAA